MKYAKDGPKSLKAFYNDARYGHGPVMSAAIALANDAERRVNDEGGLYDFVVASGELLSVAVVAYPSIIEKGIGKMLGRSFAKKKPI